jgi:hypothetical protein
MVGALGAGSLIVANTGIIGSSSIAAVTVYFPLWVGAPRDKQHRLGDLAQ